MDNLNKYLPVGEGNAIAATLMLPGPVTLGGSAWLESNTATEVMINATSSARPAKWAISGDVILGISTEGELPAAV